jgi:hypothetical protein
MGNRAQDDRDLPRGQEAADLPGPEAAVDNEREVELFGDPDRVQDILQKVGLDAGRNAPADEKRESVLGVSAKAGGLPSVRRGFWRSLPGSSDSPGRGKGLVRET